MSFPTEFHFTFSRRYNNLCILVRQPITEIKAEWNVADVRQIAYRSIRIMDNFLKLVRTPLNNLLHGF